MTFWPRPPKANLLRPAPDWVPPPVMHGVNVLHAPMVDLHDRLNKLWNSGTNHDRALCRGLLLQLLVEVLDDDTPDTLNDRIFQVECVAYPEAIELLAEGRVSVQGRTVKIEPPEESRTEEDF